MKKKLLAIISLVLTLLLIVGGIIIVYFMQGNQSPDDTNAAANNTQSTLLDYWNNKAEWDLIKTYDVPDFNPGFGAGSHIEIVNDTWYLFSRIITDGSYPSCPSHARLGINVRKSTNKVKTWSKPTTIITPTTGTPWECMATDGDAYYNTAENKWYYLFQCLAKDGNWNACFVTKNGSDPMGKFVPDKSNPVIKSVGTKNIWNFICNKSTDDCYTLAHGKSVHDAGTFDIFEYYNGYYFVSFHGYDGKNGYRGIAKTKDFKNWVAGDLKSGVPVDAILDKKDAIPWAESWKGAPIGFGAGSIIKENGYYYIASEASDYNLSCTKNQHWDFGLFRSKSITNTKWEQFPNKNPIFFSDMDPKGNAQPCNIQYLRIFKDTRTGSYYLTVLRENTNSSLNKFYLYKLTKNINSLQNGNYWKCTTNDWSSQGLTVGVYRDSINSTDGRCYLTLKCNGSSCKSNSSLYQDIVNLGSSRQISFGAKVSSSTNSTATIRIKEYDSTGKEIKVNRLNIKTGTDYQNYVKNITLNASTKKITFEFLPGSTTSYKLDEAYVNSNYYSLKLGMPTNSNKSKWKTLSSRTVYKNPWIELIEDKVIRPDGKKGIYSYVNNHEAVMIVAEADDGKIILVNQYRYPSNKDFWELPAGATDHANSMKEMAQQELFEETGIKAKKFTEMGIYYEFALVLARKNYAFLAQGFDNSAISDHSEGDEIIHKIKAFTVEEVKRMIADNSIQNAPSLAVLNIYFQKFHK